MDIGKFNYTKKVNCYLIQHSIWVLLFLENALSLLKRCFKSEFFGDLPGVETDIDDILVWGTNAEEHDQHLVAVHAE